MNRTAHYEDSIRQLAALTRADGAGSSTEKVTALFAALRAGAVVPPNEICDALHAAAKEHDWYSETKATGNREALVYVIAGSQLGDARASTELARLCVENLNADFPQTQAESYLQLALHQAQRPSPEYSVAARRLATAYERGIGAERDDLAAFQAWAAHGASVHWDTSRPTDGENNRYSARNASILGDQSFDDSGRNFEYPEDAWGVARIWWKKATGAALPYDPRILAEHLPATMPNDEDVAHAFERLGYLSYHGLAAMQSRATAFTYWRRVAHLDNRARQAAIHLLERRILQLPTHDVDRSLLSAERIDRIREMRRGAVATFRRLFPMKGDDIETCWSRHREAPSATLAGRIDVYRDLATRLDNMGAIALALTRTLFGSFAPDDSAVLIKAASERTQRVPAPIVKLYEQPEAVKGVTAALPSILEHLREAAEPWSTLPEVPKYLLEAATSDRLRPTLPTLQWCDLRLYLAEIAQEPSKPWWKELNSRLQAKSQMLADWLRRYDGAKVSLRQMTANIERATIDYGPQLNQLDADGFPIPRTRASNPRRLFPGGRAARGWESIDTIILTEDGFQVIGEETEAGTVPILTYDDVEEVLAIALLEMSERRPGADGSIDDSISFSLEPLADQHLAPVRLRFHRREIAGAEWINMTGFGRAKYFTDCLIFIDEEGNSIVSALDCYKTRATHQDGWQQPQPWRRALFGGGISASAGGRNAGVTAHGEPATNAARGQSFPYRIELPKVLRHMDGSETVYNQDGSEKHRDGGRNSLHYWTVRHASILSGEIPLMAEQFPVYQRTMQLEKVYAGVRMDLGSDLQWLRGSRLFRRLDKVRRKAVNAWQKYGPSAGVVVAH